MDSAIIKSKDFEIELPIIEGTENEKAIDVYKKGIAAASKKGDLMPLKDMQNRMNQLLQSSP